MTDIQPILQRLGLSEYCAVFVAEGFDTWDTVVDITENDLESLSVKLGHRRKLQRAIADYRGLPNERPLSALSQDLPGPEVPKLEGQPQASNHSSSSNTNKETHGTEQAKRKYRRHPKPDENAPEKPPSAYVLFSNRIREQVKAENLSFTDIARLVGERWQKLDPSQKELFESHAAALKETYNAQLNEYKKTDAYNEYTQYLNDFKAKHNNTNEAKRPKLELQHSSSLSGTSGGDANDSSTITPSHTRGDSVGSSSAVSQMGGTALQLISSMPATGALSGRRGSPSFQQGVDRRLIGQLSNQSSCLSDDFPNTKSDSTETLTRTAALSLGAPQPGTTPPPMTYRQNRPEYGFGPGGPHWQPRGHNLPPPTVSSTSPSSTVSSVPSNGTMQDHWRERGTDIRSYHSGGGPQSQASKGATQISQLIGQDLAGANPPLTLPPLRQLQGTSSNTNFLSFPGSLVPSPNHQHHQSTTPMSNGQLANAERVHDRLESEAADTLAALSDRQRKHDKSKTLRAHHGRPYMKS